MSGQFSQSTMTEVTEMLKAWRYRDAHNVPVSTLEEGTEILLNSRTHVTGIVEDVTTEDGRTTVLLIDGRATTHPATQLVTVLS